MSTPSLPSSQPVNENTFFNVLMPNRGRTRFLRGAVLLFLAFGALGSLSVTVRVLSEFYARHRWPVAQGVVTAAEVKSYSGPSSRHHVAHYFVEYEGRFAVGADPCLTGTICGYEREPLACWGIFRTRSTDSWTTANAWLERRRLNSPVGI